MESETPIEKIYDGKCRLDSWQRGVLQDLEKLTNQAEIMERLEMNFARRQITFRTQVRGAK